MQNNIFMYCYYIPCLVATNLSTDWSNFTVSAGLSTGCFVSLFSVYAILAHLCAIFSPGNEPAYMETVYPVFRLLHILPTLTYLTQMSLKLFLSRL